MTPLEIARVLGVDLTEDNPRILEALSILSIHLESRQFLECLRPEVGMLLRVKCHPNAHTFYHGRELIVTHTTSTKFFAFMTDTKQTTDGDISGLTLQFVGRASKDIWEVKYPELRTLWGKG